MGLFDSNIQRLTEQAMDAAWYKQRVISHNIANADTPDYKAKNVSFGVYFDEQICKCKYHTAQQEKKNPPCVTVSTTYESDTNQTLNGNNVDMEKEALALADVQYQYSTLIDRMNSSYRMMRTAVSKSR